MSLCLLEKYKCTSKRVILKAVMVLGFVRIKSVVLLFVLLFYKTRIFTKTRIFRSPEMIDLYSEKPLTSKLDIWVSMPTSFCKSTVCLHYFPIYRLWASCCTSCASSRFPLASRPWPSRLETSLFHQTLHSRRKCTTSYVSESRERAREAGKEREREAVQGSREREKERKRLVGRE
jgi:hypothetical protein